MTSLSIPFSTRSASTRGAPAGAPIEVPAIRSGDRLLAAVAHDASAGFISALDVSGFTVEDGQVTTDADTEGRFVRLVWTDAPVAS